MPMPNYMLDLQNSGQSVMSGFTQGLQAGGLMRQSRQQLDQQAAAKQQAQAKAEKEAKLQGDLNTLSQNPTPAALVSAMVKYPHLSEDFKRTFDVMDSSQKASRVSQASQVYAAMQSGNHEVAQQLLTDQATAARNAGMEQDAKAAEAMSQLIKLNPATAETSAGLFLASSMGPDKFVETFTKLQGERRSAELQPSKLSESQANAQKAAVAAKFAESEAALDLQKKGWDITKIQEDIKISKQNAGIAAMHAQIAREGNQIKREENQLKLHDMVQKRDEAVRTKAADLESARSTMDNMLNTADRILKTPIGVIGSAAGPVSSRMPTLTQDTADFEALVETLSSQAFMAQIPNIKGMGSLSNAEGDKLQAALQNFGLKQSPERLLENVREAQRLVMKARKNMTARAGLPETIPDTPDVSTPGADIDALVKKYGG